MDRDAAIAEIHRLLAPVGEQRYTTERYLADKRAEAEAEEGDEQRRLGRTR